MINFSIRTLALSKFWLSFVSLLSAVLFVLLLCLLFEPRWQTNDDIIMSMVAHGYGITTIGSPQLIFPNVIWGVLVRTIPEIKGVLGYSTATLGVLVIVGAVVIYTLYQLGEEAVNCLSLFALILVRPILSPQFTVNAGLLAMVAVICWHLYEQQHDRRVLIMGYLLAFLSYLIRSQEFLLILMVSLPLLQWRSLLSQRFAQIGFLSLIFIITISALIDYQSYQSDDWKAFHEFQLARVPYNDFGAGKNLQQHPDILQRYRYSHNDIDLITNWFFADAHLANPQILQKMLAELGRLPNIGNALANAWIGVKTLWHPQLQPLTLAAFMLAILRPSWRVAVSWGLVIAAVFTLGLLGRPGALRVYVPLICLLLVAPFLQAKISDWRTYLITPMLFIIMLFNASQVFSESEQFQKTVDEPLRKNLASFPSDLVIVWGGNLPFEAIYPVLLRSSSVVMSYQLYSLGWATLAPFSRSFVEQKSGRGMIELLIKETGVPIIGNTQLFQYLDIYCQEHFQGQLKELSVTNYGTIAISQRQCEPKRLTTH